MEADWLVSLLHTPLFLRSMWMDITILSLATVLVMVSSVLMEISFKDLLAIWEHVLRSMPSFMLSLLVLCAGELNLHAVIFATDSAVVALELFSPKQLSP